MLKHSSTMKILVLVVVLALAATSFSVAIPKPDEKKQRVYEKDLSDVEHIDDELEHHAEYDHEAFVGKDEAENFSDLTPEQSQERLKIIYDKIDTNQDGFVTMEELRAWIEHVQNRYIYEDSNRQWVDLNVEHGEELTWEKYASVTFSGRDDDDIDDGDKMMVRDKKRWKKADQDDNSNLSKEEFTAFLHPEENIHMREVVVEETLEDIDKNHDGAISLEEYIEDMWPYKAAEEARGTEDTEEPDWVKTEREQFTNLRDKNKDGVMDKDEVYDWIIPSDYDHNEAEANHLMQESDTDGDGKLTKEEVVTKYDLFVGSQATDFGEALTNHDEF